MISLNLPLKTMGGKRAKSRNNTTGMKGMGSKKRNGDIYDVFGRDFDSDIKPLAGGGKTGIANSFSEERKKSALKYACAVIIEDRECLFKAIKFLSLATGENIADCKYTLEEIFCVNGDVDLEKVHSVVDEFEGSAKNKKNKMVL